jgi:hypothetical protein
VASDAICSVLLSLLQNFTHGLCRYAGAPDAVSDPAFDNFHICADVTQQMSRQLSLPGAQTACVEVALDMAWKAHSSEHARTSILPGPPTYGAKAKPFGSIPAANAAGQITCGWQGATLHVEVEISKPCVAAWAPPPKPSKALRDIVPPRTMDMPADKDNAVLAFKRKVAGA